MGDLVGELLAISSSQTQLIAGAEQFILNKDISNYKWMDNGWIHSLWSFLNELDIKVAYREGWTPQKPRTGDVFLMDYFLTRNVRDSVLRILKR